ncbi:MAG: hypothetical protein RLW61_21505 [Gammaproteobacteria bacterium]
MSRSITRLAALLASVALAAPVAAHEGMQLSGTLHRLLHFLGTDTVLALGGVAIALLAVAVLRRSARRAAGRAPR